MSLAQTQRQQVLLLYRQILRLGKNWQSKSQNLTETETERRYIREEARRLFNKNRDLTDSKAIADCIHEGQARVEMALHYRIPYPRPVNMPPMAMAKRKGKEQGKFQERLKEQSKPIYIKSID